jgi:hypothetical protein
MADREGTNSEVLAAQAEMFRLAERDHKLTLKAISTETGIELTTLKSWCRSNIFARARIGLPDFVVLCKVIPDDCTSLVLEPAGKHVATSDCEDGDFNELTTEAVGFAADKLAREADGVICHIDEAKLKERARRLQSVAQRASRPRKVRAA